MQIVFAVFVTLKSGMKKVKLHLNKAIDILMDGEKVNTQDVWVFATSLYDVLMSQGIDILRLKPSEVAFFMRNATIKFHFELDENGLWENAAIDEIILTDYNIDSMMESILLEQLPPAQREKRLEKRAVLAATAVKAAAAKARKELEANLAAAEVASLKADAIERAEQFLANAEAAYACDPTPYNKGKVTRARRELEEAKKA